MSTVSMMIEAAERLSEARAAVKNPAQAPCKHRDDQADDEPEANKTEVNSEAVFRQ